jgi:alkaline phosphatase D
VKRRTFLHRTLAAGVSAAFAPAIVRASQSRPSMPQGVAVGDAGRGRAVVWSRCDRPARLFVDYATTSRFENVRTIRGPVALPTSDQTARVVLTGLPPGQQIFYRVRFQDLADLRSWSDPVEGTFNTAVAAGSRDLMIAWSADSVGQGWGLNREFGGLKLYETMLKVAPDLFIHCGDTIYADGVLQPEVALDDGTVWRNLVTPAKAKVAETLDDYRGNYQYNLLDDHMRRFNAAVAQTVLWDDHEVRDNWYDARDLSSDKRYTISSTALLASRARQAFFEYNPLAIDGDDPERVYRVAASGPLIEVFALDLRSYRGANSENRQARLDETSRIMGAAQVDWLQTRLAASQATWKVIANDMPLGLVVRDAPSFFEAVANGDSGPPLGRELEIAEILRFIRNQRIRNVVWITADVHYCAAHHYAPERAAFREFDAFWEFVAGPLHAGTFAPNALDATFGPEVMFSGVPADLKPNRPPSSGLQFFGTLRIDARTRVLTAALHDLSGRSLYNVDLEPVR